MQPHISDDQATYTTRSAPMAHGKLTRRSLLQLSASATVALMGAVRPTHASSAFEQRTVPVREITRGPRHHWFGYYDKLQFDPTNRYVLAQQVRFEHRSPTPEDKIVIGMVDIQENDRWVELGTSSAWCWQQGCMLQWLPGSPDTVLWNDRESNRYVCRILNVQTGALRTIPHAIYAVSPDGKTAISTSFSRLGDVRPGYGYNGIPDPYALDLAPRETGIFRVDLHSGRADLILSVADIARTGTIPQENPGIKHYFNHLLFNQDGSRFIALHRWRYPDGTRLTRLITANPDGSDVRIVIPNGYASHFVWRDPQHIFVQTKEYLENPNWSNFVFEDKENGVVEEIGRNILDGAGHGSFLPGGQWILNDTYPQGSQRLQTPHLFHIATKRRIDLGHFHSPALYTGEWRCDTHPRLSPNGKLVCIDSPSPRAGRQLHLLDISEIVG